MVFVNFSGTRVNSIAYAVTAIVLLPINSALNPILYSDFLDETWKKLKAYRETYGNPTISADVRESTRTNQTSRM